MIILSSRCYSVVPTPPLNITLYCNTVSQRPFCAVVDNLPKVPKEKLEKLMGVIERIFGQAGTIKDGMPSCSCHHFE